jgi:tRNA-2-methylthio-N6-dimethylallyladenosine synthase
MSKKVLIKTFGCQMNGYDSDKIADVLKTAQGDGSTDKVDNVDEAASLHWHHFHDLTS